MRPTTTKGDYTSIKLCNGLTVNIKSKQTDGILDIEVEEAYDFLLYKGEILKDIFETIDFQSLFFNIFLTDSSLIVF